MAKVKSGSVWKDQIGNFWLVGAVSKSGKSVRIVRCRSNGSRRGCRDKVFTRRTTSLLKWGDCAHRT